MNWFEMASQWEVEAGDGCLGPEHHNVRLHRYTGLRSSPSG